MPTNAPRAIFRTVALSLLSSAFFVFLFSFGAASAYADGWYNADWQYRVKVTIDHNKVSSDLTDFPVYVDLSDMPSSFFSQVKKGVRISA